MAKTKVIDSPAGEQQIGPDVVVSWAPTNVVLAGENPTDDPDGMITVNFFFDENGNDISYEVAKEVARAVAAKF